MFTACTEKKTILYSIRSTGTGERNKLPRYRKYVRLVMLLYAFNTGRLEKNLC